MTWTLSRDLAERMVAHALADHPIEACGVLLGTGDVASEVVPLTNVAHSASFYEVDSAELLALYRRLDTEGLDLVAIYHSHTSTPARPSTTDVELAFEPHAYYVLLSTAREAVDLAAFRIVDGNVDPVDLRIGVP